MSNMCEGGEFMSEEKKVAASETKELKRGIKGWQVAFIGIGGVIGSCYFLGIGACLSSMGPGVLIAFLVTGIIVYGTMISYSELLVNVPRTGSFVAYTSEFLTPTVSTGFGWAFWFNWVCYVPSEAIAVSTVLTGLMRTDSTVTYVAIALGAMAAITLINLCAVDVFAKIESGLAITKVIVIIVFILAAFGIWVGLWGQNDQYTGFLAGVVNFSGTMSFGAKVFPLGIMAVLVNMTVVLVTFQGTEIVGLAAAESQNPEESVPKACKSVTYRIALLYLLPLILVILVYPYELASDANPVFSDIMNFYGIEWLGFVFSAVVLVAAFSCANTGFYGTVRCMFGLSIEGLAPKFLGKVTESGNPRNSVFWTLIFMWIVLILGLTSEVTGMMTSLYTSLLSLSGFTGTLAWVGIILSHLSLRRKLKKNGYDPETCLKARVSKGQSWIPVFAVIAQVICLIMLVFEDPLIFFIACGAIFLPMLGYQLAKRLGKLRDASELASTNEATFEELFPPLNKTNK